ncbi:hypothetical protein [Labedaea rhizosphaerae]|uniref:Tetratricopeptide repeat protein n=1 Tax=Labedaea rhizosphaerae TaxID=598644 RepID=A0A4R6SGT3_LABRH|nr:hypothetical protein [Labedaea rhizosphaerae]TDQ00566.1 hypothetical protein EV186_102427 [Labedaea rhizosphaerae]
MIVAAARPVTGAEPLVEIIDTLLIELRLAGASGRPSPDYLRRRRFIRMLTEVAEEDLGLRFTANLPFLGTTAAATELGRPLAGYTLRLPDYRPSTWLEDLWVRWRALAQPDDPHWEALDRSGRDIDDPAPEERRTRGAERYFQVSSLLRGAIWCGVNDEAGDPVTAAVRFVVELAATGQASNRAAATAVSLLLDAAADIGSADDLLCRFTEGPRPTTVEQWHRVGLRWPQSDAGSTTSRAAQQAMAWLVGYGQEQLDDARAARDFDSWRVAMVAVRCAITCVIEGLRDPRRMPLGLRAIISQFDEIYCDQFGALGSAEARYLGRPEIEGQVVAIRTIAADRQGRLEEARLARFVQERALVPAELFTLDIPYPAGPAVASPLPPEWHGPTWRTITAGNAEPRTLRIDQSSPYRPARAPAQEAAEDLSRAVQQIQLRYQSQDTAAGHRILAELRARYPWHDMVHGLNAELHHADNNVHEAVQAAVAAAVLRPEVAHYWLWLARLLRRQGHDQAAATAAKIAQYANGFTEAMKRLS